MYNEVKWKRNGGRVLYGVSLGMLINMLVMALNQSIWLDESIELTISKSSLQNILTFSSIDVSPPFLHLLLKIVFVIARFAIKDVNYIIIAKIVVMIPFFILLFITSTKVKKKYGWFCAGLFSFCILSMPNMLERSTEIRTYSWALLFVSLVFIYSLEIIYSSKRKQWCLLTLFSIITAFTHYYAFIDVMIIYFFLFLYFLLKRKHEIRNLIISSIVIVICYLPWVLHVFLNIVAAASSFWIEPINLRTVLGFIWYVMCPQIFRYHLSGVLGIISLFFFARITLYRLKDSKGDDREVFATLIGVMVLASVIAIMILGSLVWVPMCGNRFIYPCLGGFWLCYCISIAKISNRKVKILTIALLFVIGFIGYTYTIKTEYSYAHNYVETAGKMEELIDENTVIVSDSGHVIFTVAYYYPNVKCYLYNNEKDGMIVSYYYRDLYGNLYNFPEKYDGKNISNIIYLEQIENSTSFLKQCKKLDVRIENIGTYRLEDRTFGVYNIIRSVN